MRRNILTKTVQKIRIIIKKKNFHGQYFTNQYLVFRPDYRLGIPKNQDQYPVTSVLGPTLKNYPLISNYVHFLTNINLIIFLLF